MAHRAPPKGVRGRTPLEVGPAARRFAAADLSLLDQVQPVAEELVGDRFQLSSFGPPVRCYEVVTQAGCGPECLAEEALAMLCRYDRRERPIGSERRLSRFYRICLQDDNLLARVDEGLSLRGLFLVVLTHELIHIVRFESFAVSYNATGAARDREEREVEALTREVLEPLRDPPVSEVIEALSSGGVDVLVAQE